MLCLKNNTVNKDKAVSVLCLAVVSLFAFLFSITARSQFLTPVHAGTDSSVFQYVARVMLNGGVPYLDTFDHKGPLLYVLNAFSLWISPSKGLWYVELITLIVSFLLMYRTACLFCKKVTSVFVVFAIIPLLSSFFEGGNLTEEYAMPFIAGTVYIFADFFLNGKLTRLRLILCGASMGFVLLLRVNMIAVWIVMCLGVLFYSIHKREYKKIWFYLSFFMLGLLIAVAPFIIWLSSQGALKDFIKDYILFNFSYSSDEERADGFAKTFSFLHFFYQPLVTVSCGVSAVIFLKKKNLLAGLCFLSLLVTLLLICISGQTYLHYGAILVPIIIIPLAYVGKLCDNALDGKQFCVVFLVGYLLITSVLPTWHAISNEVLTSYQDKGEEKIDATVLAVSSWVKENTEEDEQIIVCGNWNVIYNLSDRFAVSKYSYQSPIATINPDIEKEFFEDLRENKPAAIVIQNGFFAQNKMFEYAKENNYTRAHIDSVGDNAILFLPAQN